MMRKANLVSGLVLAVGGLLAIFILIPWQIAPGPEGMMSPRLVPQIMAGMITALSVLLVVQNLRPQPGDEAEPLPIGRADLLAFLRIGGVFAVAVALFLFVSPLAAGVALVLGALLVLGERRIWMLVAMPAGLMLVLWLLFYRLLGTAIV